MEIYQLKVFLEVARHLSFTEAADALNLTQPAVSAKIKALESQLGASLFHRLGRKVELTSVGQFLWEKGPQLVNLESQLLEEIESIKQGKSGSLKIGCLTEIKDCWLPEILFDYRRQYPTVETHLVCFSSAEALYRALMDGRVDVGLSGISLRGFEDIYEMAIDDIEYGIVLARDHPLTQTEWTRLEALRQEPWVLLPEGSASRLVLEKRLGELGLSLADFPRLEIVDHPSLVRTFLLQGGCITFASNLEFTLERQVGLLDALPLEEFALGSHVFLQMPGRLASLMQEVAPTPGRRGTGQRHPLQSFARMVQGRLAGSPFAVGAWRRPAAARVTGVSPLRLTAPSLVLRAARTPEGERLAVRIGTQHRTIQTATAGLIIQRLRLLEHFLPREGRYSRVEYDLQWSDYSSGAPIVGGLRSHQLDIGILGDYPLLLSALTAQGETGGTQLISFVCTNPDGSGNDVIVPRQSRLNSIEDLRGRVIGVPFQSAAHGMIMRSLHRNNLIDDVKLTAIHNLASSAVPSSTGKVDGYAYFAPFHSIARHQGKFRRLLEGNIAGLPTFHGVVVQQTLADTYPEIVIAYLQALLAAQYWYTTTPNASALVAQWVGLDPAIVAQTLTPQSAPHSDSLFRPETAIRADWLQAHIDQLVSIIGHEHFHQINLNRWVHPDLLASACATLA